MSKFASSCKWPSKAVVTAGMPYGNKPLHFGHIGGVFIPADVFARFLRDRIGTDNVRFVSGTDCYGSPIEEGYRKACEAGFAGTLHDYVSKNHDDQYEALEAFDISLDIFEGSGLGHAGEVHQEVTYSIVRRLYETGHLNLISTRQFFDEEAGKFLNGRQVLGKCCPVQGCKAQKAYADECELGHQYNPEDLMDPISTVTGTKPIMKPVDNWYFDLQDYREFLQSRVDKMKEDPEIRPLLPRTIEDFLIQPKIYIKNELFEQYESIKSELPPHVFREAEKGKASFDITFSNIVDRDLARDVLERANIRFRTSKALVPFRITGNVEWGVKAPVIDDVTGLTVWCWPESLWAPISFTIAANDARGLNKETWQEFWCSEDSEIFQFIGQDNIYFYGVAQPAIWDALGDKGVEGSKAHGPLRQTTLVANHHLLFGKTKASSSGDVKPPTGEELLEHYTPEQLRAHFIALGLDQRSVAFSPKPFDPKLTDEQREDKRVADPVLKESALLTNIFNRLARSCLYEAAKSFDGSIPVEAPSQEVAQATMNALSDFEKAMRCLELHSALHVADEYIRFANKYWSDGIKKASDIEEDSFESRKQVLNDSAYMLWVSSVLMHPIVPFGTEMICEKMGFEQEDFFSWDAGFESLADICTPEEAEKGMHAVQELPPRFDFFSKHPSQYK